MHVARDACGVGQRRLAICVAFEVRRRGLEGETRRRGDGAGDADVSNNSAGEEPISWSEVADSDRPSVTVLTQYATGILILVMMLPIL